MQQYRGIRLPRILNSHDDNWLMKATLTEGKSAPDNGEKKGWEMKEAFPTLQERLAS